MQYRNGAATANASRCPDGRERLNPFLLLADRTNRDAGKKRLRVPAVAAGIQPAFFNVLAAFVKEHRQQGQARPDIRVLKKKKC